VLELVEENDERSLSRLDCQELEGLILAGEAEAGGAEQNAGGLAGEHSELLTLRLLVGLDDDDAATLESGAEQEALADAAPAPDDHEGGRVRSHMAQLDQFLLAVDEGLELNHCRKIP